MDGLLVTQQLLCSFFYASQVFMAEFSKRFHKNTGHLKALFLVSGKAHETIPWGWIPQHELVGSRL